MSFWRDRPVLVTGGAGFIGHRLVAKLIEHGARVTVVDDLSKGEMENLKPYVKHVKFRRRDLLESISVKRLLKNTDFCFHLAAKIGGIGYFHKLPATSLRDNSIINLNLWDAARETDTKMICLSSSMVFERTNTFPTPEIAITTSPPPLTGYGFSKLMAEYIAKTYHEEFGIEYVIIRPFNAYGPGEVPGDYVGYAHVIPDLVKKVLSGQYPLEILGSGKQTRSYTYVDDIADGIVYFSQLAKNDDFNIASANETTVLDLAKLIWKLCARKELIRFKHITPFEYDVKRRVPDVSKAKSFGWIAKTSLESGLRTTIEYLRKEL
jgi:nucleoside-diphosphate-sugar epimerase